MAVSRVSRLDRSLSGVKRLQQGPLRDKRTGPGAPHKEEQRKEPAKKPGRRGHGGVICCVAQGARGGKGGGSQPERKKGERRKGRGGEGKVRHAYLTVTLLSYHLCANTESIQPVTITAHSGRELGSPCRCPQRSSADCSRLLSGVPSLLV